MSGNKIAIIGPVGVGKTSIIRRASGNGFSEHEISSVGSQFTEIKLPFPDAGPGVFIDACLWDTAGQEQYSALVPMIVRGARVIIYVFDVCSQESFDSLGKYFNLVEKHCNPGETFGILVGNKTDSDKRVITTEEGFNKSEYYMTEEFIETSAKTGFGIDTLLSSIASILYYKFPDKGFMTESSGLEPSSDSNDSKQDKKSCC